LGRGKREEREEGEQSLFRLLFLFTSKEKGRERREEK